MRWERASSLRCSTDQLLTAGVGMRRYPPDQRCSCARCLLGKHFAATFNPQSMRWPMRKTSTFVAFAIATLSVSAPAHAGPWVVVGTTDYNGERAALLIEPSSVKRDEGTATFNSMLVIRDDDFTVYVNELKADCELYSYEQVKATEIKNFDVTREIGYEPSKYVGRTGDMQNLLSVACGDAKPEGPFFGDPVLDIHKEWRKNPRK